MIRFLERLFGWFQSVGAAGDEIARLKMRMDALEAELKSRPGPEFCPSCASPLAMKSYRAIARAYGAGSWGEERTYRCTACEYERKVDVEFKG